ncbi:MAG: MarR family winged helix-turn-helix transcriptional regulator, partial [Candidatus Limnocylindria bacterium]
MKRRLERELAEGGEISLSEFGVLATLAPAGAAGVRLSELADRVLLTRSGLTRLVDRLADRGYVARRVC